MYQQDDTVKNNTVKDCRGGKRNGTSYAYRRSFSANNKSAARFKADGQRCKRKMWRDQLCHTPAQVAVSPMIMVQEDRGDGQKSRKDLRDCAAKSWKGSLVRIETRSWPMIEKHLIDERSILHRLRTGQLDLATRYQDFETDDGYYADRTMAQRQLSHPLYAAVIEGKTDEVGHWLALWPRWFRLTFPTPSLWGTSDYEVYTLLELAVLHGQEETVKLLLNPTANRSSGRLYALGALYWSFPRILWRMMKQQNHNMLTFLVKHLSTTDHLVPILRRAYEETSSDPLWQDSTTLASIELGLPVLPLAAQDTIVSSLSMSLPLDILSIVLRYAAASFDSVRSLDCEST